MTVSKRHLSSNIVLQTIERRGEENGTFRRDRIPQKRTRRRTIDESNGSAGIHIWHVAFNDRSDVTDLFYKSVQYFYGCRAGAVFCDRLHTSCFRWGEDL